MSDTSAAIRAAHEVQAESYAPELLRQAKEWYQRARNEYKMKNFQEASEYAKRARTFAEQAEYEAIRSGGNRVHTPPDPASPFVEAPPPEPVLELTPTPEPLPTRAGTLHRPDETPEPAPTALTTAVPASVPTVATPPPPLP